MIEAIKYIDHVSIDVDGIEYPFNFRMISYIGINIYDILIAVKNVYERSPDRIITHSIPLGFYEGEQHTMQISIFEGGIYYSIIKRDPINNKCKISNNSMSYEELVKGIESIYNILQEYYNEIKEVEE